MGEYIGYKDLRPAAQAAHWHERTLLITLLLSVLRQDDLCQIRFVRVPDHRRNTRQRSNLPRRTLGVTSRHNDFASGILPADAADSSPPGLLSRSSHGAGVQDNLTSCSPVRATVH